ncbi:PREDICTED: uncharacterized protein LOC103322330 [Prunus mume]|uniref:Uncharacterized protein LOC103322330 n=1 Tax=Prunus mume TaxID=102107 RepID=A0ABM1LKU6_PRUMU|nr:PREDICTED: uncharacterized protein LOC103322330 [Prunus mume]
MVNLYTHSPTSCISLEVVTDMIGALDLLNSLKSLLREVGFANERSQLVLKDCLRKLGSLRKFCVPNLKILEKIRKFCLANASLIFCIVSSSAKLQTQKKAPLHLLVIDEVAQLKECESAIPLQHPGLRHAVLIGDERQLPAMVISKISEKRRVVLEEVCSEDLYCWDMRGTFSMSGIECIHQSAYSQKWSFTTTGY